VFLERKFNFSASQLSYVIVYNSIAMGLGIMFLIPLLTKWLKPVQSLSLFSVFLALSYVICLLPQSPAALWMTIPPVGLGLAVAITNGSLIISNASSSTFQGQALGTLTSVQVLAEIITGLSGGVLAAHTVDLPLYIGAFMTLICAGLLLFSMKRREQDV
jgi:predicted MFS family arabinose efflux permease